MSQWLSTTAVHQQPADAGALKVHSLSLAHLFFYCAPSSFLLGTGNACDPGPANPSKLQEMGGISPNHC